MYGLFSCFYLTNIAFSIPKVKERIICKGKMKAKQKQAPATQKLGFKKMTLNRK